MREIEFKGKNLESGEWAYGDLLQNSDGVRFAIVPKNNGYSIFDDLLVDEDTIGQYIDIKDKNGRKIFEGDVCRHSDSVNYPRQLVVEWIDEFACFAFVDKEDFNKNHYFGKGDRNSIEVVGNIHDKQTLKNK